MRTPITVTGIYNGQERRMTLRTATGNWKCSGHSGGYVIAIAPPIETVSTGDDVEGIGWVPHRPRTLVQKIAGWYKTKSIGLDALQRYAKK